MDQLNNILSSLTPDDVESLKSLANSLLSGAGNGDADGGLGSLFGNMSQNGSNSSSADNDDSDNPFASLDPEMIGKIGAIMGKLNSHKDDNRIRLLRALKPMLSDKRKKKTDEAIKIMSLFEILPELKNLNIF